jgi:hypothetical protein
MHEGRPVSPGACFSREKKKWEGGNCAIVPLELDAEHLIHLQYGNDDSWGQISKES